MEIDNSEHYIDLFCSMLNKENLKCTPMRQDILRIFFLKKHFCVEVILEELKKSFNYEVTIQSVYLTLKLLLSYNIISKYNNDGRIYYELTRGDKHFHFICTKCHNYIEFNDYELKKIILDTAQRNQFVANTLDISMYGLCKNCN